MKLSNTALDELVLSTVGEDVLPLVHILRIKNNISEFKLAEMLNITVNQTRNILYRLNEQNLVGFIRKKDKKKGWYIYYWSLNKKSIEGALRKVKLKQVEDLRLRLAREEEGMFYVCPMGCMRLQMEAAMEHEFRCQECGTLMKEQDNKKTIANIKKMILGIEEEMKEEQEKGTQQKKGGDEKRKKERKEKRPFVEKKKKIIEKVKKKVLKRKFPLKKRV